MTNEHNSQVPNVKSSIEQLSESWKQDLRLAIKAHPELPSNDRVIERYISAFPPEYQALYSVEDCISDIETIRSLTPSSPLRVSIEDTARTRSRYRHEAHQTPASATVVLYRHGGELSVSKTLPILEGAGLEVLSSSSIEACPEELSSVFIHRLPVRPKFDPNDTDHIPPSFSKGLEDIFNGLAEHDALNSLLLRGPLEIGAVGLLRAYSCLLWQVRKFATRGTIFDSLASSPRIAVLLWELFRVRFDPSTEQSIESRNTSAAGLVSQIQDELRAVKEINKDRILRSLVALIQHTVRTNFFSPGRGALALKLHSEKLDILPNPKPMYEMFIRSPLFEGCHLRASKVARGGIRWSDRNDDYRTEVLGLMKTQKVKNVLIVPSGAKGGFAIRHLPKDAAEVPRAVESCYREYIRACLSIADNRVDDVIVHPPGLVIYDQPDPYFVVAADKGTATFSDVANKIAVDEFNFWLGDAFASGGSKGYDHKLYGITARGTWECVKRHFNDLGIRYTEEPFTVVGVGDMSGDVFGNGLLMSNKAKLVAAFNHVHIFIDPTPDPESSFKERERLFNLSRSRWTDYNKALISKGGGVFDRFDKEIHLTPEIRAALHIPSDAPATVNGDELITFILKAPCDLLWNGGIGTYVKATTESNVDVNDGTNDRVRINADELRARVIGEGGNLGMTQRGRIEAGLHGVALNTDAIDNSAGVDLSDHEVNLKILFSGLIRSGKLTSEQRDVIMLEIADDVTSRVLDHNRNHASMLSLATMRSRKSLAYIQSLLHRLTKLGYINRSLDVLPDDEALAERTRRQIGMSRPELAVCLAGVKMWIKDILLESPLVKDPLLKSYLLHYFPAQLRATYGEDIVNHTLANNIIATEVTNSLVDAVGITFVHRMCGNHSVLPITVIKCVLAAEEILGSREARSALSTLDAPATNSQFLAMRRELSGGLRDATAWLIGRHGHDLSLEDMVRQYKAPFAAFVDQAESVLSATDGDAFRAGILRYSTYGLDQAVSRRLAAVPFINRALELLRISQRTGVSIEIISKIDSQVISELNLTSLLYPSQLPETTTKWEHQLLLGSYDDLRRSVSRNTEKLAQMGLINSQDIVARIRRSPSFEAISNMLEELRGVAPSVAAIAVVSKQLRGFSL